MGFGHLDLDLELNNLVKEFNKLLLTMRMGFEQMDLDLEPNNQQIMVDLQIVVARDKEEVRARVEAKEDTKAATKMDTSPTEETNPEQID